MKVIEYQYAVGERINSAVMTWNEINEETVKNLAVDGKYIIRESTPEDFPPEDEWVTTQPSSEERIKELEEALALLLSGDTR